MIKNNKSFLSMEHYAERVDATLLKPTVTAHDIENLCDSAERYHFHCVCVPPCYVSLCKERLRNSRVKIATVVGFPFGYDRPSTKIEATLSALANGADEIDAVMNITWFKSGKYDAVLNELISLRAACKGRVLKIIIEACCLNEQEKILICRLLAEAKVDYLKTSTGYGSKGAQIEDILLFRKHLPPSIAIKAAGGIDSLAKMNEFIMAGADRIGTSHAEVIFIQLEKQWLIRH